MERLTDDLLIDILSLLPPKSIVDSKRVSNQWYKIISSKLFQSRYKSILTKNPGQCSQIIGFIPVYLNQLHCETPESTDEHPIPPPQTIATSNGLLLNRDRDLRFSICNPITGEKPLLLPHQDIIIKNFAVGFNVISTDAVSTTNPNHCPSFEIILLQLPEPDDDRDLLRLRIFSSQTWSWSPLQGQRMGKSAARSLKIKPYQTAVVLNQTYYWLNGTKSILKYVASDEGETIKKAEFIQLPQSSKGYQHNSGDDTLLGVTMDGLLRFAESRTYNKILVWIHVNNVWESMYSVRFKRLSKQVADVVTENFGAGNNCYLQPVAFDPLNPDLVFLKFGGKLLVYDQGTKVLKPVEVPECKGLVRFPWKESCRTRLLPYLSCTWATDYVFTPLPQEEI